MCVQLELGPYTTSLETMSDPINSCYVVSLKNLT